MGKLIVPNTAPKDAPKEICSDFFDAKEFLKQTNEEWVDSVIKKGEVTTVGSEIMSAIKKAKEDIYVYLVLSQFVGSQFDPDIPMVVLNIGKAHYLPSLEPTPIGATILLFHELGHAAQWILRREWFMSSKYKSNQNKEEYYVEIEKDNLERYERPMCMQLKQPWRLHYDDIYNDTGKAQQRWNKMNDAALTIQRAWMRYKKTKKK